jgi:UDP-glucose 4-epimerase
MCVGVRSKKVLERIAELTGKAAPRCYDVDLRDYEALSDVFRGEPKVGSVIHFAGFKVRRKWRRGRC